MHNNVKNRSIFCHDNIDVLEGINSECIDLIYLDPPFNKKKVFTAPIGSSAAGASFRDIFRKEHVKGEWLEIIKKNNDGLHTLLESVKIIEGGTSYNFCYLSYMAIRLIEMRRILKDTGSLYLHCDSTMSHYLKILMDLIFGEKNFRSEIIWNGGSVSGYKSQKKGWIRQYDNILYYTKTQQFTFNKIFFPYREEYIRKMFKKDEKGRYYRQRSHKKYYSDEGGVPCGHNWHDILSIQTITQSKQVVSYPTQKPLALMERIIRASSNKQDMVLDPFCGCATTCVAAEKLERQWIGIDVSIKAFELVKERLKKEVADPESLLQYENKVHCDTSPPKRTYQDKDRREKK